eukprot:CAMPEP_0181316446 /NCGR_PEP_ID=MMETSP1101-20121128/15899_1 /TAXON_ID=46948 /ORGANISM="Rhodomonas abbreviata, Strain Caron Lab Isolate" /LENGTH=358 /DNA_ID=CAMNT_0023423693 /DNA_START=105 /DNA_END=1178 /DNA_ORIENTATION=-
MVLYTRNLKSSYLLPQAISSVLFLFLFSGLVSPALSEAIDSFVTLNGFDYATLDGVDPSTPPIEDTEHVFLTVPDGWSIATNTADARAVAGSYPWGAVALVLEGGLLVVTADHGCLNRDDSETQKSCAGDIHDVVKPNSEDGQGGIKPFGGPARILIVRPSCVGLDCDTNDAAEATDPEEESGEVCDETKAATCHILAYCQEDGCVCPEGMIGDGTTACDTDGWTVRTLYTSCAAPLSGEIASLQGSAEAVVVNFDPASGILEVHQLYSTDATLPDVSGAPSAVTVGGGTTCQPWSYGSRIYTWNAGTSSGEARVLPTGLTLDSVAYASTCTDSPAGAAGCWVIGVTYTTGGDEAFNA